MTDIDQAQANLERARARANKERKARLTRPVRDLDEFAAQFTLAEERRLPELRSQVEAEVVALLDAEGIDKGLLEVAVDLRARQLLRQEIDPGWQGNREAEDQERKDREFVARLKAWRFPDKIIRALQTMKDPGDLRPVPLAEKSDLYETDCLKWIRIGVAKKRQLCVMVGALGTGKTLASCWATWEDAKGHRADIIYATAREVFTKSDRMDKDREWLDRVAGCSVLILDECGTKEERDESDSKQLAALLHSRFEHDKRTIVLANMEQGEFARRYTDAVMSRVYESGGLHNCGQIVRRGELKRQGILKLTGADDEQGK